MKVRDVIKMLDDDGWIVARQRGSHRQFRHTSKPGLVTVAGKPGDDLAPGRVEAMRYLIVIEPTSTGFSAYSPDVPGCIATGATRDEVEREMREAISFHLDGLREDGMKIPEPQALSSYVEVPV